MQAYVTSLDDVNMVCGKINNPTVVSEEGGKETLGSANSGTALACWR